MMEGEPAEHLPKAVLHDHLDGGLRVQTMIELADSCGYEALPAQSPDALAAAMNQGSSGSLLRYLDAFVHTVALMQTAPAIERVAYECGLDHHAAGVVYGEIRVGPGLLTEGELTLEQAIEAALAGLAAASAQTGIELSLIVSALRHMDDSEAVARAAGTFATNGVVGFDLAGPEAGYPPQAHLPAIEIAREYGLGITIHAGEGDGVESIAAALNATSADRIGHGVRIIEDCTIDRGEIVDLGAVARQVHEDHIPLEVAISSNLHTGIAASASQHPFGMLCRAGFNVSINTDNRLMSGVDMASEVGLAMAAFELDTQDLAAITRNALGAGFANPETLMRLTESVDAAYASLSSSGP